MSRPLVSIAVPTRNRASSLRKSLETIRAQDYSPIEILVSDNCSEDDTEQVCREVMAADPRMRYVRHEKNIGLHANHNFCMDASRGEYLCIFHDHDTRALHIVSEYVEFFAKHPRVGVVCSDWDLIDDGGRQLGVRDHHVQEVTPGLEYIDRTMKSGRTSIGIPGAMVRRSALGEARFGADAPIGFGDFPLWFRVAETWDVGHISRRLWSWRQNRESHSARTIESISHDYEANLGSYCDDHLKRWPDHRALVDRWRANIRRYLFWALAYEVGMHFRKPESRLQRGTSRSLFEIMDYRLTPEQFDNALARMKAYRTGPSEYAASAAIITLIRLHLTRPVGWVTQHQLAVRTVLGLK